ncbi:MAG: hypothetical protein ABR972_02505 [Acidimicrobiales bacterium]
MPPGRAAAQGRSRCELQLPVRTALGVHGRVFASVLFLVFAALLGLGAASWPARRAAKLDVLAAIAAD